jgi:hypothetical protein
MAVQLVKRAQQMMLIAQPVFVFCDDGRTVAVRAYPERIAPVCTDNLNAGVAVMKSAQDGA